MAESGLLAFEVGSRLIGPVIDPGAWSRFAGDAPLPGSRGPPGAAADGSMSVDDTELGATPDQSAAQQKAPLVVPAIKDAKIIDMIVNEELKDLHDDKPTKEKVITDFDRLLTVVEESGEITSSSVADMLNLPVGKVEKWARILESNGLLILDYPFLKEPILRRLPEEKPEELI